MEATINTDSGETRTFEDVHTVRTNESMTGDVRVEVWITPPAPSPDDDSEWYIFIKPDDTEVTKE